MRTAFMIALSTAALILANDVSAQPPQTTGPQLPTELIPPPLPVRPLPSPSGSGQTPPLHPAIEVPPAPVDPAHTATVPASSPASQLLENVRPAPSPADELVTLQNEVNALTTQLVALQKAEQKDDQAKKQVELLQKQIETQQKMIQLILEQLKKQPPAGAALEKLQTDTAQLQSRSRQAAQRDQEVTQAIDNLNEHMDANERYGPRLPWALKALFLPSGNQETPVSIYGTLCTGYSRLFGDAPSAANGIGRPFIPGGFYFGEASFQFLVGINDWAFISAEVAVGGDGSMSGGAYLNADFFVNDWLTVVVGRMVAPIGSFNDRLNMPFITKLPVDAPGSVPLLWQQVLPIFTLEGVEAKGAFYLGCSPFKFEYAAYVSNGLNVTPATAGAPTLTELADLGSMTNSFNIISNEKAFGGRIGLWWPEMGLNAGFSAMTNGLYIAGTFRDILNLWAVDLNYHEGNWDLRFEYGHTYQQTAEFLGANIRRQGVNAQIAFRPRDNLNKFLQKTELVYRFGYVVFEGINPAALDLTAFSTPVGVPVRRLQNEMGVNYWFSDRMVLKLAYQVNDEPDFHLHDNQILCELAWGW